MTNITLSANTAERAATLSASGLPPRVRELLSGFLVQLELQLQPSFEQALGAAEHLLMKQAADARSSEQQAALIAASRSARANGAQLLPAMLRVIEAELASIREIAEESPTSKVGGEDGFRTITLVEDHVIDQEIVLREMARRCEARARQALQHLGLRFATLSASPAIESNRVPCGPYSLCKALQASSGVLQIDELESLLVIFRSIESDVLVRLESSYEVLNKWLAQQGVLPNLVHSPRRRRDRRTPVDAAKTGNPHLDPTANEDLPMTGWHSLDLSSGWSQTDTEAVSHAIDPAGAPTTTAPSSGLASNPSIDQDLAVALQRSLQGTVVAASSSAAARANAATAPVGETAGSDGGDTPTAGQPAGATQAPAGRRAGTTDPSLASLHEFLQQRRKVMGNPDLAQAPASATTVRVSTNDVLSQLSGLQVQSVDVVRGQPRRTFSDVQRVVRNALRDESGQEPALAQQDSDKFQLLDMLYKEIEREVKPEAQCVELLIRLQIPVARVSLLDPHFFSSGQHPVRELLNTVAESGAIWQGEEEDSELVRKLQGAVDRVVSEYDGDNAVFESVNRDIRQHLETVARRAALNERRQIKAAQGKEQLEVSRRQASQLIANALADQETSPALREVLDQVWHDALTLTLLRKGESSEDWQAVKAATVGITKAIDPQSGPVDPSLPPQITRTLVAAGYGEDEANRFAQTLTQAPSAQDPAAEARIKDLLRSRNWAAAKQKAPQPETLPARDADEQKYYDYLLTLPFGTWFEFVQNQQGDVQRRRLSWYSQLTDNALFVNQHGQRVAETTLDKLSRLMSRDQARVVVQKKARLIDRAWRATVDALRAFT